jgi:hypothetical protein
MDSGRIQRNVLDRETALHVWTDYITWLSNEEGKKGRIQVGQFADLIVPDRDYFSCAEDKIADTTSDFTIVGGKVVYAAGDFRLLDDSGPPPAMPDWSPVRRFGGYGALGVSQGAGEPALLSSLAQSCGCDRACHVHGHDHATAWSGKLPVSDLWSFWSALGCTCWAV